MPQQTTTFPWQIPRKFARICGSIGLCALLAVTVVAPQASLAAAQSANRSNLIADADLGIYLTVAAEELDRPAAAQNADAQAFFDQMLIHVARVSPSLAAVDGAKLRTTLRLRPPHTPQAAFNELERFVTETLNSLPPSGRDALSLGIAVTQLDYNAGIEHNPAVAARYRSVVGQLPVLDAYFPAFHDLRLSAIAVANDDWGRQDEAARALKTIIVDAADTRPAPETTVAALTAFRTITGNGPRTGFAAIVVEFVTSLGRVHTLQSYTDGTAAAPHGRLHCGVDHEPYHAASYALPLQIPIPKTTNFDDSINGFVNACSNFQHTSQLTYNFSRTENSVMNGLFAAIDPPDQRIIMQRISIAKHR